MRNFWPRYSSVALAVLICLSLYDAQYLVWAGQVNITVDDTDPSIVYQPATSWFASGNASSCAFCLAPSSPSIAFKGTWHHGLHIIPTTDADDNTVRSGGKGKGKGTPDARRAVRFARRHDADEDGDDDQDDKPYDSDSSDAGISPFSVQKLDSDDPGFVDTPVSLHLNFTGSAIYLYCLLPLGLPPTANGTPTFTNLTFTLDGQPIGTFIQNGSEEGSGFQPNTSVLSANGLADSLHTLEVTLGPDSVFLFDYYVFTQENGVGSVPPDGTSTTLSPAPSTMPPVEDAKTKKHNVATFAGAVGGSVGLLSTIAACLAFSIYRRRRQSALRQRGERGYASNDTDSFHTDASEDGPPMQGPAPFVPRFFPGTVPVAPPPYVAPLFPPSPSGSAPSDSTSPTYADRPPSAPFPPPLLPFSTEDAEQVDDVPPPFVVAIASPEPPILANVMRRPPPVRRPPPPPFADEEAAVDPTLTPMAERQLDEPSASISIFPPRLPRLRPVPSPPTDIAASDTPRTEPFDRLEEAGSVERG